MKADWVSFDEAVELVLGGVDQLPPETRGLDEALGRVLARELVSPIDLPPWTNSGMDGFAVRAIDVAGATAESPVELPVVDDVPAGGFPRGPLAAGTAARVMTGAPVPEAADTVVRVEHTDGGSGWGGERPRVRIFSDADSLRNLRRKAEELAKGGVGMRAGEVLSAAAIGVAASLGYAKVDVVRRPEVALLTSGDELVGLDRFDEVRAGRKIVSSNTYTLAAQLTGIGCRVRHLGIAADTPESLRSALAGAAGCDALITSAGISVGEHDYIRTVLLELRAEVEFWRVRIRPGSPFAFGRVGGLGGIPWFGLPGNPVSSMVTFEIFARPALLRMSGHEAIMRRRVPVKLLDQLSTPGGLTQLLRVRLETDDAGGWCARLTGPQGSGMLSSMARADALLIVPATLAGAAPGTMLQAIPLDRGLLTLPARTRDES